MPIFGYPEGQNWSKLPKIDLFYKNVPNHPGFAPGKFGGPKPNQKGSFGPITLKKLYIAPLLTKHWSADISWSRPKFAKNQLFYKNVPNHPDFAPGEFGGPKPIKKGSFGLIIPKNLYIAPLLTKHCLADISWSRPKLPKIDFFYKKVPHHPDFWEFRPTSWDIGHTMFGQ